MNRKGITLIELLVALCVSGILVGGIYRTFISQQHTYTVQEQVVDMQQNVRLAVNRMTRELRMAGFGRMDATFFSGGGVHGAFANVVTPGGGGTSVTVVGGYQEVSTLKADALTGSNKVVLNASSFDVDKKKYISINGLESHRVKNITGDAMAGYTIDLIDNLTVDHLTGERVYLIMAVTYSLGNFEGKSCLLRDENLGAGPQPVAENIENLQFAYLDANGNPTANPADIRMIQVTLVARSDQVDADLAKAGDGFRRRTLSTNIQLRNLLFS